MVRLTEAVVKSTDLPVTVKTRLGWDESSKNIEEVAERLQDVGNKKPCPSMEELASKCTKAKQIGRLLPR